MHDITEEAAALERLARVHGQWRAQRPPPPPGHDELSKAQLTEIWRKPQNPEPQDVEVIQAVEKDPLGAAIWSQLSVVGWRLYAKGGVALLLQVYGPMEGEHHPGFVYAVRRSWQGIGFAGDSRGVWLGTELL